jgi:hypothetical protein
MKPGLETAIREHLELFDDEGMPNKSVIWAVLRSTVLRLRSEFDIETGNSETVDIPVMDGQPRKMTLDGTHLHNEVDVCKDFGCIPVRDGER